MLSPIFRQLGFLLVFSTVSAFSIGAVGDSAKTANLSLHVTLASAPGDPAPAVALGEKMIFNFELKNTSSKPQTVRHCGFWPNHRVRLLADDETELTLTEKGRTTRSVWGDCGGKNAPWTIPAGETDNTEGGYDLTTLFEISDPGRYTLAVDWRDHGQTSSVRLPIWVLPKAAKQALDRLNSWDPEELDVAQRPGAYPQRAASGETNGWISSNQEFLNDYGVYVAWDGPARKFKVVSSIYAPNSRLVKRDEQRCSSDADCVAVKADCCGCTAGGRGTSIAKTKLELYKTRFAEQCSSVACVAVMSSHASCIGVVPACRDGFCAFRHPTPKK